MSKEKIRMDEKPFVLIERENDIMVTPNAKQMTATMFVDNFVSGPHTFKNSPLQDHWDVYDSEGNKIDKKYEPTAVFVEELKKKNNML